jgi:NADP-dependent 3-hydroxy acid dehydrogenase YdfG
MKTAIVTGASNGIGKAIALKLASLNYAMVVIGRSERHLAAIKETIEDMGSPCLTLAIDLNEEETPEIIIRETLTRFGRIDLLVNNAGLAHSGPIYETAIDSEQLIQPEEIAELVQFLVTRKGKGTIDHFYIRRQSGLAFD